ncbi:sialate O-acetylesterase [Pontiella agarivorans]|uniref:Sialate O-acetylesterase n=1 Tax=Pontiella agarivorans TaxID=3038953 RepID=A0ABU5MT49_9BACT|nr:sialate O-acetylesterase [Pontiella agarivorans]MDZ8117360.1 sialate O-acetylesterase [Pontiella agarivorans]
MKLLSSIFIMAGVCTFAGGPVQVLFLGGQSNMGGHGNYDALSENDRSRIEAVAPRVMLSRNGGAATPLAPLESEYELKKRGFIHCFGPEMFIGLTLAEKNPDQDFLLIKIAQGGTALYGAWNPEWSEEKAKAIEVGTRKQQMKLYQQHISVIKENLAQLKAQGRKYNLIGMVWMQGENDAAKEISSRSYKSNLKKLIAGYRSTFNQPDMPFVAGQINSRYGDFEEGPAMVRQAFIDVANDDARVKVIRTVPQPPWSDFPKHEDQVHYNAIGQKRLGLAMADALLALQQEQKESADQ